MRNYINTITTHILFITLLLAIPSCTFKSDKAETIINKDLSFLPDSSISGLIFLRNDSLTEMKCGDLMGIIDNSLAYPSGYISNIDTTEVAKITIYPGDTYNTFSVIEVSNYSNQPIKKYFPVKHFITESGIKLGVNKNEVIEIKGNLFVEKNNSIEYKASEKNKFLLKKNFPFYTASYEFKNDTLSKFQFGFDYP